LFLHAAGFMSFTRFLCVAYALSFDLPVWHTLALIERLTWLSVSLMPRRRLTIALRSSPLLSVFRFVCLPRYRGATALLTW